MISYVPVWKLSARCYRGYHFPRVICIEQRHVEMVEIIEVRRAASANTPSITRAAINSSARENVRARRQGPKGENYEIKSAYIVGKKRKKKKEKRKKKRREKKGLKKRTRVKFALLWRSYRQCNDVGYLAARRRFQIGIRIANAPIGKVLWIYCVSKVGERERERMMERDARGARYTEAFDCTLELIKVLVWKRRAQRHLLLYLLNIGRRNFSDPANRINDMAHLLLYIVDCYRDNLCESR